jgi:hypothetical protein
MALKFEHLGPPCMHLAPANQLPALLACNLVYSSAVALLRTAVFLAKCLQVNAAADLLYVTT